MGIMDRLRRNRAETEPEELRPEAMQPEEEQLGFEPRMGVGAFSRQDSMIPINEALAEPVIGKEQLRKAMDTLRRYKAGKANLERRIIENDQWWKQRHWNYIKERGTTNLKTKSAWLVNVILSKHADAMDATPEPNCLPRAADDQQEAAMLSKIVPVILQGCDFDATWSENWWKKLKAGLAIYGVFWDRDALNGMGDVAVRVIDPLTIFWEPGVKNLQDSQNIFCVSLVDNDLLISDYPELEGKLNAKALTVNEYIYDDSVDTSNKSPVVDWYYKKREGGRTVLHYVKFVGEAVLFASENEDDLTERGIYDHGMYPFFEDVLFPEEGTPAGYGYIDICKDAQRQIDLLNNAIVANAVASATPRWFKRGDDGVNEEEFLDWTKPFVHVQGSLDEAVMRQIQVNPMPGNLIAVLDQKVAEMKETSGNRDVNNGGSPAGVTAASAIAAMQEQSGKLSRDQIQSSYSCYRRIVYCVIELIRQFYDLPRQFRIIGADGQQQFVNYDNSGLLPGTTEADGMARMEDVIRKPVFDIEVSAQKQSAYNKLSYNELAIQFYQLGFFNPQAADPALAALEMMDFKGKELVRQRIEKNGGMFQLIQQLQAQVQMLSAQLGLPPMVEAAGAPAEPSPQQNPVELPDEDPDRKKNKIVEKAKGRAQEATQPR